MAREPEGSPGVSGAAVPDDLSPARGGDGRAQVCPGPSLFRLDTRIGAFDLQEERVPDAVEPAFPRTHREREFPEAETVTLC